VNPEKALVKRASLLCRAWLSLDRGPGQICAKTAAAAVKQPCFKVSLLSILPPLCSVQWTLCRRPSSAGEHVELFLEAPQVLQWTVGGEAVSSCRGAVGALNAKVP